MNNGIIKNQYLSLKNDLSLIYKDLNECSSLINDFIKSLPEGLDSTYNKIDNIKVMEKSITSISDDIKSKYLIEVDKNIAKI